MKTSLVGNILTVEVDLSKTVGESKSGKMLVVAGGTKGFVRPDSAPQALMKMEVYVNKPRDVAAE